MNILNYFQTFIGIYIICVVFLNLTGSLLLWFKHRFVLPKLYAAMFRGIYGVCQIKCDIPIILL